MTADCTRCGHDVDAHVAPFGSTACQIKRCPCAMYRALDRPLGDYGPCKQCQHGNEAHNSIAGCTTRVGYDKTTECACTEGMTA